MSDAAIKAKTGRDWAGWCRLLDRAGAMKMPHRDIARLVDTLHDAGGWYSQSVTVGYERLRGLRAEHQRRGGLFEAAVSRTLPIAATSVFARIADSRKRRAWLGESIHVRTATAPRLLRLTWPDDTHVEVGIVARGARRCTITVQHTKLPDVKACERRKLFWKSALARLAAISARAPRLSG